MPADLAARAREVLERNWMGAATRPGERLYPHQWSWDSAFIAIGWAHVAPERAASELRTLFAAQWPNGMVPSIVFSGDGGGYFPGPDVWQAKRPGTTGIVQPPVHASALWRVHAVTRDDGLLEELYEPMARWHAYLHRERDPDGDGLVAIRHPWESGRDNSPTWDAALAAMPLPRDHRPRYRRVDLTLVAADERPEPADYDAYVALVECFKRHGYEERAMREGCPFWVDDAAFNALLARADEDLGRIAERLGRDPAGHRADAERVAGALNAGLWDERAGLYFARDRVREAPLPARTSGCFTPLVCSAPGPRRAARLVETLASSAFWDGLGIATYDRRAPGFSRRRYWRGPIWISLNWLLWQGLRRHGFAAEAARLRAETLALVEREGFSEYFDPVTGQARGVDGFSWTAALVLDWLSDEGM